MNVSYNQVSKNTVRNSALQHAVELLTTRRQHAAVVSRDHVRNVRDLMQNRSTSYDKNAVISLSDQSIIKWEEFWDFQVGQRAAADLTVAYLAGPEPLNDFRELTRLGVEPNNIWAFESDNNVYNAALREVRKSEFPLLKLQRGTIDQYIRSVPRSFDIIYLDACGPLPSRGQRTLGAISDIFRHNKLLSPGVLITNFSLPDTSDKRQQNSYADMVTGYLYPKGMLENADENEFEDDHWNLDDGPMAHGFEPRNDSDTQESFYHEVSSNFEYYYGQYITRQLFDLASFISPWISFCNSESWKLLFSKTPMEIAKLSVDFGMVADDDVSTLVTDPDFFPIGWSLVSLANTGGAQNCNFFSTSTDAQKLLSKWQSQLCGSPEPKYRKSDG